MAKIIINGEKWTLKWSRSIRLAGEDCWGLCERDTRTIRLHSSLRGEDLLRVLFHEVGHATSAAVSEEFVDANADHSVSALMHPEVQKRLEQPKPRGRK